MNECLKPVNPEERARKVVTQVWDRFKVPKNGPMFAMMISLMEHNLREFAADHAANCIILNEMEHAMDKNPKLFGYNKYE